MSAATNVTAQIPGTPSSSPARALRSPAFLCSVVLALTFITYAETLSFDFVHDDRGQIVDNPAIRSWANIPEYFTAHVWAGLSPEEAGNYYRPLFLLWLRLNDAVWGLKPWGWHLTTVLAHLVATLLVYLLAYRILLDPLYAAVSALIFGLHPAHIEGVAWISGVTEPLLGVLLVASFLCYLRRQDLPAHATRWIACSLLFYLLALLEKETALVLPAVIFSYELLAASGEKEVASRGAVSLAEIMQRTRRALWSAIPYLALVPFYLWARVHALKGLSHVVTPLPLSTVLYTWPSLLWFWVKHLVWPVGLSTFYDLPYVTQPGFANFTLPAIGVAGVVLGLCWGAWRRFEIAFACLWLVWPLLPVLDIRVFPLGVFASDRYLYLPSVGLAIVAAVVFERLRRGSPAVQGVSALQILPTLLVASLMAFGTAYQSFYFQNNLVFCEHNVLSAPNNKIARTNLAAMLGESGQYEEAIRIYQQVLALDPGYWYANYNLGYTYYQMGRLEQAESYLERAIAIHPNNADEYLYLGLTLLKMGHAGEAASALRRAIAIRPRGMGYHFALGLALKLQGNLRGALAEFEEEISLNPQQAPARREIDQIQATLNGQGSR